MSCDSVINLGVVISNSFDMASFISSKLRTANDHSYLIRKSRNYLTYHFCKILVSSSVLSVWTITLYY